MAMVAVPLAPACSTCRGINHPTNHCHLPRVRTVDEVIRETRILTDEQRVLAWCPMPPLEPSAASDCRIGGSCGLDLYSETLLSRWLIARFRYQKAERVRP